MKRTDYERETSITMNDKESEAILWTSQAPMLRKMHKLGVAVHRDMGEGKSFKIPKTWVSVRVPKKMNLSEDQRKAIGERLKIKTKAL